MFGLFSKPQPFTDPVLGEFEFSKGKWKGLCGLAGQDVPLLIVGNKEAPDARCLDLARELGKLYAQLQDNIRQSLYAHFEPYKEQSPAVVANDDSLWQHVKVLGAVVMPIAGIPTVEIAYTTAWDEEHTLGAYIQSGKLLELNGSILSPF